MSDELKPAYAVITPRLGPAPVGFSPGAGLMDLNAMQGSTVGTNRGENNPDGLSEQDEEFLRKLNQIWYDYFADQDPADDFADAADRQEMGQEIRRLYDVFDAYVNGEISREQFENEFNYPNKDLNDVPGFQDWFNEAANYVSGGTEEGTEGEGDPSTVSDADAIANVIAKLPDQLKGIVTEDNIIEVLKTLGGIEDPMTAIKRGMIAGIEIEFPKDWRDWKVFGTIRIPGVPLPPGIVDVTLGDIEEAVKNVGGTFSDFIEGIEDGSSWEKVKDWVRGVWNGVTDEDEWGKTIGGFEGYIKGILGNVVGGFIFSDIYDEIKGWFEDDPLAPPPVGGEDEDDNGGDADPTPLQGDDIADFEPDFEGDTDLELGDDFDDDDDDDTTGGIPGVELGDPEEIDTPVVIPGGDDGDDDEITLGDPEDDDEEELGGGGMSFGAGGGGKGLFEGGIRGLSYTPQPIPTVKPPEFVDAMASIGGLIANLSSKNGRNA